jgi:hypothetical protein
LIICRQSFEPLVRAALHEDFGRAGVCVYQNVSRIDYPAKGDAPMKVLQVYSGEETQTVWTGTIKRLLHRYLEHRNKRRACGIKIP